MVVRRHTVSEVRPAERREGSLQLGGGVGCIIVRHRSTAARFQRQVRLGTIQRLNLSLFIHSQHRRPLGGQIEADNIAQLFHKPMIAAGLERRDAVRSQTVLPPNVPYGRSGNCLYFAIEWMLQCVARRGRLCNVASTIAARLASLIAGRRRERGGAFSIPAVRRVRTLPRHNCAVGRKAPTRRAIAGFSTPSVTSRKIFAY